MALEGIRDEEEEGWGGEQCQEREMLPLLFWGIKLSPICSSSTGGGGKDDKSAAVCSSCIYG